MTYNQLKSLIAKLESEGMYEVLPLFAHPLTLRSVRVLTQLKSEVSWSLTRSQRRLAQGLSLATERDLLSVELRLIELKRALENAHHIIQTIEERDEREE